MHFVQMLATTYSVATKLPMAEHPFTEYLRKSKSLELLFFFKPLTPSEVKFQILSLPNSKSHDLSSCPTRLLKYSSDVNKNYLQFFQTYSIHLSLLGPNPKNLQCQKLYPSSTTMTRPMLLIKSQFHYYQILIEI